MVWTKWVRKFGSSLLEWQMWFHMASTVKFHEKQPPKTQSQKSTFPPHFSWIFSSTPGKGWSWNCPGACPSFRITVSTQGFIVGSQTIPQSTKLFVQPTRHGIGSKLVAEKMDVNIKNDLKQDCSLQKSLKLRTDMNGYIYIYTYII